MHASATVRVRTSQWIPAPVRLGRGQREFAIGDVHGLSGHLRALLAVMGRASKGMGHLTLLGDLCDRGPDSLGCYQAAFGSDPVSMGFAGRTGLLGNHEIFMLRVMEVDPDSDAVLALWCHNGGDKVLDQLEEMDLPTGRRATVVARSLRHALGEGLSASIEGMDTHRETGNLMFVHGGLNPAVPITEWFARTRLECSTEDHFAWIRFPFFGHEGPYEGERIVVHGHTPEPRIQQWKRGVGTPGEHVLDGWRLGLDGGSYATGLVAGAEFRNGAYRIYLAGRLPAVVAM
jgi:hypothetical protein